MTGDRGISPVLISPWVSPERGQPQALASAQTLLVPWLGQRPLLGYSSGRCPVRLVGQTSPEGSDCRNQVIRPGWAGLAVHTGEAAGIRPTPSLPGSPRKARFPISRSRREHP